MLEDEIHESWRAPLANFAGSPEGRETLRKLHLLLGRAPASYNPARADVFAAFRATPFDKVRVVIIGQDPYPNPDYATGLAFATPIGQPMGKSMAMIYCAIATDLGGKIPTHGNLDHLTQQGVFLLNRMLTFSKNDLTVHRNAGWQVFTQAVVTLLASSERPIHFMLWGKKAQKIKLPPDYPERLIHKAPHPSPLNINSEEFRICRHFSKVNAILVARKMKVQRGEEERIEGVNYEPINWFPAPPDPILND